MSKVIQMPSRNAQPAAAKWPPLSPERERLILLPQVMKLVEHIAKSVGSRVPPSFDLSDLTGPGYVGLVKAGHKFRFESEAGDERPVEERFLAYARRWIEGSIKEAVRRRNWTEANAPHVEDMDQPDRLAVDTRQNPEELAIESERRDRIHSAMELLDEREAKIISIQFGNSEASLPEVSKHVDLSPCWTGVVSRGARAKMKRRLRIAA